MKEHIYMVIPCAGNGSRFGGQLPKQYALIDDHTVLWHTLNAVVAVDAIKEVWVIANSSDNYIDEYVTISPKINIAKVGGSTRANSVLNGLLHLDGMLRENDWVLVHDAARCCIEPELINNLITEVQKKSVNNGSFREGSLREPSIHEYSFDESVDCVGGILGIKAVDTIKQVESIKQQIKHVIKTIDRNTIYLAQTPQMFRYVVLKNALLNSSFTGVAVTDESSAVEMSGYTVSVIDGDVNNIKVTYPQDIELAKFILGSRCNIKL
jgi:2-C-methyl-D-erythritol 4-phosphate cytidylyltransferase